ncbi:hypothetical protein SSX86_023385 [Deinandra increscens subsp. villosa]|uniref:Vacuolar protein sorting-associated protein 62 n=1 Tax=Deinandra increscens subsp. villosa TaxID=3103831 RepID=A0AAP0GPV1_9ASTR
MFSLATAHDSYSPPDPLKVLAMMEAYAPLVYFHPDEECFPSSVSWFFENGAELHQKSGQTPTRVINNGDNLPRNGGPDDSFLDLPSGQANKERVKKGFLSDAVGYVHAKPALRGRCTDLAIWLYYPFNAGEKFQLGPFVISLGKIGQHVSDWEHITLRVDNANGGLKAVYLSQHSKGKWFTPKEFELLNGTSRPIVYASLSAHAHYATPSSHIHLAGKLDPRVIRMLYNEVMNSSKESNIITGFGIRDDTSKSDMAMDLASAFDIVYIDNFDVGIELPWLNYTGRWGPKISYNFTNEVKNITQDLPDIVKDLVIEGLKRLPAEAFGEEGPQGPKMKKSWSGDERV